MKVLQLVNTPRSFFDKQVEALEARGVDCTTVTVPGTAGPTESRSVTDYLRYYPQVLDHSRDDYDLVHAHYGLMAPFALAQPIRPVVLTLWGSDLMAEESHVQTLSRFGARHSDEVILPTAAMQPYLDTDHHLLPWGVDRELFRPIDQQRARAKLGWDPSATIVLFPYPEGREIKNYPRAERVVDTLDRDVTLKTMHGVAYDDVPVHMNAADAVLLTSDRESGPMVVKEAAACNVPVVSTDVGFVSDVLDGSSHSHVCEDEHGLARALGAVLDAGARSDGRSAITGLDGMGSSLRSIYEAALDRH